MKVPSHSDRLSYGPPDHVIDLGRVKLEFHQSTEVYPWCIRVRHDCVCGDGKTRSCAPTLWAGSEIVSTDPITITPSIACNFCDLHGWVTDGKWIDAG